MNKIQLAVAGVIAAGASLVAAPDAANAGGFSIGVGFGHGYGYGYGYRPVAYGGYGYYRPRRVVVVHRPYRWAYHPPVRRVVVVHRPYGWGYHRPYRVRYVSHYHRPYRYGW